MMKIKKQDKIIIQKKIDGLLSVSEEERFIELMETSPDALGYYRKIGILHHTLQLDSSHIPGVDLSNQIIQGLKPGNKNRRLLHEKKYLLKPFNLRQMLVYAALLTIGLIFGAMVTYFGFSPHKLPDSKEVSGTIAKPAENSHTFNQAGTMINVQDFESSEFRMLIVEIETADTVFCAFRDSAKKGSPESLKLLYSKGSFQFTKKDGDMQNYLCNGRNIFMINTESLTDRDSIRFFRKQKLLYVYKM